MYVVINPDTDRTRAVRIRGVVKDVLTRNPDHPHGVKVTLQSGETGRVKELLSAESEAPQQLAPKVDAVDVETLLKQGENHFVEFKTSAFWSKHLSKENLTQHDSLEAKQHGKRASVFIIAKAIAGFANADGGTLVIGVKEIKGADNVEVVGIESEFDKIKDRTIDGYRRAIVDEIIQRYLPSFFFHRINDHLQIHFPEIEHKPLCQLNILKSAQEVFLKTQNKDMFFARMDASTREIQGEKILQYCKKRFGN
jgi:uncharacterized repeat protein (TIGR03833 family)